MPNPEISQYHDHDTNTVYDYKDARSRERITELEKYPYKIVSVYTMVGGGYTQDHRGYIFDIYHRVNDSYFTRNYDGSCIRCIFPPQTLDYDPDTDLYFSTGVYQEQRIMPVYKDVDQTTPLQWGDVNGFVVDFVFRVSGDTGYFVVLSSPSSVSASNVSYDNTISGLSAGNVQNAIDEVNAEKIGDNPTFTEAATRQNIASGETFAVILGKIKKFFSDLKAVAFSGSYNDLTDTPTIPAAQVQSDWTQADSGAVDYIKNKPTLATVATSGAYGDLSGTPTLATVATSGKASDVSYNNTGTSLTDTDVQTAISSLANNKADSSSLARVATTGESYDVSYNNGTSGLSSSNVKDAIDELALDLSGKQGTLTAGNNISISSGNVIDSNARGIDVNGAATINPNDAINLNLVEGSNMSITANGANVTFAATDTKPSNGTYDSSPAAVLLASGSNWQCISNAPIFTAQAGQVWLFQIALEYQGNASGLRGVGLSGSTTTAPTVIFKQQVPAVTTSGTVTNLTLCSFVAPTSTTSYYIWGRQNSGSSLNVTYRYRAIRLL